MQTFLILACGAIGGPLFDRYGSQVIYPSAFLYLVGLMLTSVCDKVWQFVLTQDILTGIASGVLLTPAMAATPQYFCKNRDLAMGLAVAGSSIGGVVLPLALNGLMHNEHLGFGWAVRIPAFVTSGLLCFACIAIQPRLSPRNTRFWKLGVFRHPAYWLMCATAFVLFLAQFQPLFFVPTYAQQHGMSEWMAAYVVPIINAASFPGRVIPALISARIGRFNVLLYACISSGVIVFCWPAARYNTAIIVWSAIYGFCSGALTSGMSVAFTVSARDPKDYGTCIGMGLTTASFGVLIGPPISGTLFLRYHGFKQVSILAGTLMLLGAAMVVLIKKLSGYKLLSAN